MREVLPSLCKITYLLSWRSWHGRCFNGTDRFFRRDTLGRTVRGNPNALILRRETRLQQWLRNALPRLGGSLNL
ncbi:MAG: hypothetical protein PUP93_11165 [Rhizonema sp. NSF051]|nr:hypothetical protein [Rhizonema sp. NSF051]